MSVIVRPVAPGKAGLLPGLCELLRDNVEGGASVGFLVPLDAHAARDYWREVLGAIGPSLALWVAEQGGEIVGSVQLAPAGRENGRHRAEVQKLLVLQRHRGKHIASSLMAALEAFATDQGRSLLVLDTQKGSAAEAVYQRLGWQRAGEIPDFAAMPDGRLTATVLYYKRLMA
ncbi:GNAT family N-acetyltransferase [Lysobacter korlensis]|uniref:GNAT family N-acetyltransferase n=1 Tax=Lysobacter korlensis TaxID=553636 RepID=A0ABV6RR54_9GAMM